MDCIICFKPTDAIICIECVKTYILQMKGVRMMKNTRGKGKIEKTDKSIVSFKCSGCNDFGKCTKSYLKERCGLCKSKLIQVK